MSISSGSKILASDVNSHINNKSNPHAVTASQIGGLATVATTGSYNDLKDKPSISEWKKVFTKTYTLSGSYNVKSLDTIPTLVTLENIIKSSPTTKSNSLRIKLLCFC